MNIEVLLHNGWYVDTYIYLENTTYYWNWEIFNADFELSGVKSRFSESATKFEKVTHSDLTLSEYIDFKEPNSYTNYI